MRRKFINTNSLIFIILIAIFTLTSYVCDQGVIRQEDNIRKSDIKIDNLTTKVYDVNTISNQLLSLQDFITNSLVELNRDNLFWIKSLILLEKNSKVADTKMIDNVIDYDYIIEKTKNRFIYHYSEIIYNSLEINTKLEYIHGWNESYFKDYYDSEGYYIAEILNYDFQSIFKNNINSFHTKDFNKYFPPNTDKALKEFNNLNFLDIYKFSHFLIRNMESYYTIIGEEMQRIDSMSFEYSDKLYSELSINKMVSSLKNYLVLGSIISQILSLFFLLLFFRNLLINKS
tara:strand:- start:90 stop:950 length:861 start_codon:yes stop_codon:yes gene_type:complete